MESNQYDIAIIGGGILGLSTAMQLLDRAPDWRVAVIDCADEMNQSAANALLKILTGPILGESE